MLIEKLKTWSYYYNKLPLYVRNSYGTAEHFKMLFDLLVQLDLTEDKLLKCFDIMDPNYLDIIQEVAYQNDDELIVNEIDEQTADIGESIIDPGDYITAEYDETETYMLDVIAELYGVSRTFDVTVDGTVYPLHLTDEQLLMLIKQRIIQYNYDGSYKTAKDFYESVGLPIFIYNAAGDSGHAMLYLKTDDLDIEGRDEAIYLMFMAGLFTIESMGISYETISVNVGQLMIWDDQEKGWDSHNWL